MSPRILVVTDETILNKTLVARLRREGFTSEGVRGAGEARNVLDEDWDLILVDLRLPDAVGLDFLRELHEQSQDRLLVVMTSESSLEEAVQAIKLGAQDYLKKPFEGDELVLKVRKVLETTAIRREVLAERFRRVGLEGIAALKGGSPAMKAIHEAVRRVAGSDASTVLVTGESGTGKDLVARAIHAESRRARAPFMTMSCTAIAEPLLESELFGHEKGAFTGAIARKKGLLELADGGTVFLDEIGDLPPALQAKLLRFLQEKTFKRVSGTSDIAVDVRIVAATHQPLAQRVEEGRFRGDLYYRLKVVDIAVPPLRERPEDVPALAECFIRALNAELRRDVEGLAPDAREMLARHAWPGNVRELRNAIERAMILGRSKIIRAVDLPIEVRSEAQAAHAAPRPEIAEPAPLAPAHAAAAPAPSPAAPGAYRLPASGVDLEKLERELVLQAMAVAKGNKTRAGALLGLNRDQVRYRLEKYGK